MRRMLLAVVLFVAAQSALAQQNAPPCNGDITIVRVSTIKATGSLQGFLKAQDAHLAWYRNHGFKDNRIYSARVLVQDKDTKQFKFSDTEIMSFHVRPPRTDNAQHDAAWDTYVKQYRDNSDIKSETIVCMPKSS